MKRGLLIFPEDVIDNLLDALLNQTISARQELS
jgi:hypothetical protein